MIRLKSASDDYSTAAAFGASWVLHGLCVLAAWMICIQTGDGDHTDAALVATIEDESGPDVFEQVETEFELVAESSGGSPPPAAQFELPAQTLDAPDLAVPSTEVFISQSLEVAHVNWAGSAIDEGFSLRSGTGISTGDGGGDGKFFGLGAEGDSFVFVVDASGSMGRPYPAPARNRFNRVKTELVRTIGEMSPEQKFFIIFFNSEMLPMPANRLMPAEPIFQQQYLNWMAQVPVGGDTEPEDALLLALYLQPDVIYFLTDGAFAYKVTESVRRANRGGIPIHTIGFGDNEGEEWLLKIADQSGGSYQFITQENDALLNPEDDSTAQ